MGHVIIPKSKLGQHLDEAARLKAAAIELLRELEQKATGQDTPQPGGWRHDPLGWQERQKKS
jgi:hypothetical protein